MQPVQGNLGKKFYKRDGDCKIGLSCDDPRQYKSIKAACNAPSYGFKQRLVMTIVCHAFWQFVWIYEKQLRWARPLSLAFSCVHQSLYECAHAFYGYWHKVQVSSAPPAPSSSLASFTLPMFRPRTK